MIARHHTFINEPFSYHITILHLFCPNEPPFKQTHEPQRKTKERNMCVFVKKKKKKKKGNGREEKCKRNLPVICGDVLLVGGISLT